MRGCFLGDEHNLSLISESEACIVNSALTKLLLTWRSFHSLDLQNFCVFNCDVGFKTSITSRKSGRKSQGATSTTFFNNRLIHFSFADMWSLVSIPNTIMV